MLQRLLIITFAIFFSSTGAFAFQDDINDYPFDFTKTQEIKALEKTFINPGNPQVLGASTACLIDTQLDQNLKRGARDGEYNGYTKALVSQVYVLQNHLKDLGFYSGLIDGDFGPATQAAVKKAQLSLNLGSDGILGPNTRSEINSVCMQ